MESQQSIYITALNKKGWGLGHSERGAIEVFGALPTEEVEVELGRWRRGKCQGRLRRVVQPSKSRIELKCGHAAQCGGCSWQQMDYAAQLRIKEEQLRALFGDAVLRSIISCDMPWEYRNKMEFSFSQNKAGERFLGLMIAGSKGHVLNLEECYLVSGWFTEVLRAVRKWWEASGLDAYRMNDSGTLRTLIGREGKRTGDKLVMLTVSGNPAFAMTKTQMNDFVEAVNSVVGKERVALFLRVQQACKGFPTQFFEMHLSGPDHLMEKCVVEGKEYIFKISPSSFFQPNTYQAEKLYAEALKMIQGTKAHIMDLYAGIGTLGLICAQKAKRVTAIELNPYAVYDGEVNTEINGIDHCAMVRGDVGTVLESMQQKEDFVIPDLVIVDPPRTGLDGAAIGHLIGLGPKEIIYISCNPATQAANCEELVKAGYRVEAVQPVDQFPHTIHVETIALLKK